MHRSLKCIAKIPQSLFQKFISQVRATCKDSITPYEDLYATFHDHIIQLLILIIDRLYLHG